MERKDAQSDYTPLTPIMADEDTLDAPRAALADAERVLHLVKDLATLGTAAFPDPAKALAEAQRIYDERKSAVDTILDKMLNHPEQM